MQNQLRFLSVPQNLPTPVDVETSRRISSIRKTILKGQNRDGSFGGQGSLERIVTTSQAVLALSALGDHRDQKRVDRALRWLSKARVLNNEYSYWSLAPFNCSDGFDAEVDQMFDKADQLAEANLKHHPNSPLPNFLIEQAALLDRSTKFTVSETKKVSELLKDSDRVGKEAAQVISHTALVGVLADALDETGLREINRILESKAADDGQSLRWPGNISATCYVLINLIIITAITESKAFEQTIERAYAAIVYAKDHNEVLSVLPAGGDFKRPEVYTNAVLLRAFLRFWSWKKCWRQIGITQFDLKRLRERRLQFFIGLAVTVTIISWFAEPSFLVLERFLVTDDEGVPDYWETLGRTANVLGLLGFPGVIAIFLLSGRYLYERFLVD